MGVPVHHAYGSAPEQFGEFAAPAGDGVPPLVVHVHGGFWHADHDLAHARPYCAALRRGGMATLNLEYRRVGNPGGGWPGTFDDLEAGLGLVSTLAATGAIDPDRVVVTGHSAGGHLALWVADVTRVPLRGVVAVAAVTDLVAADRERLSDRRTAARDLLGATPEEAPDRYRRASPVDQVPLRVPAVLVHGRRDTSVPPSQSRTYVTADRKAGGRARLVEVADEDHFAVLDPGSRTFDVTRTAILELLANHDAAPRR